MDTDSGPDSTDAQPAELAELRRLFAEFGDAQTTQTQSLDIITGKFNELESISRRNQSGLFLMEASLKAFRNETSGKFERLDNNVTWLQGHFAAREGVLIGLSAEMAELRDDVKGLKTEVAVLQTEVGEIKDNVTVIEVKVDKLQDGITEILDRLPAKAA